MCIIATVPAKSTLPLHERMMKNVSIEPNSGCWLWVGTVDLNGYARFAEVIRGKHYNRIAHRAIYTALIGPIPEGLQLDHLCRVRCCVNPQHLEPVTLQENLRRGEGNRAALKALRALTDAPTSARWPATTPRNLTR